MIRLAGQRPAPTDDCAPGLALVHALPLVRAGLKLLAARGGQVCRFVEARDLGAIPAFAACEVLLVDQAEWMARHYLFAGLDVSVGLIGPSGPCPPLDVLRGARVKAWAPIDAEPENIVLMARKLLQRQEFFLNRAQPGAVGLDRLTSRQIEVLSLVTSGMANKEIARRLGVHESTIKAHVAAILVKLDCRRRTEAVGRFLNGFGFTAPAERVAQTRI